MSANLLDRLAIPIIQAPMLGGSTAAMTLAVGRVGGMGQLAAGGFSADQVGEEIAALKAASDQPFAVNFLMTEPARPGGDVVEAAMARLRPWYELRGIPVPLAPNDFAPDFAAQFEALLRAAPPAASFAFSILTQAQVRALHDREVFVIGTATTVAEARAWAAVGADAICAQGSEAGGHRGTFLKPAEESLVGTMALVATIRAAVSLPVIAAGGIMDGRGVAAALALGAVAAQMGTAFLLADQTAANATWRTAIEAAGDDPTRLTRAITGRYARGIENQIMRELRPVEGDVPAYPVQNRLTQSLRAAAAKAGDASVLSLWAGQGVKLAEAGDAGEMVLRWWEEAKAASAALPTRTGG